VLNCRSATHTVFTLDVLRNRWIVGGLLLANVLQFLVIYTEPMNHLFKTVPIPLADVFLIVSSPAACCGWRKRGSGWPAAA
jgi:magnesium-transporting ATPase (P-type)